MGYDIQDLIYIIGASFFFGFAFAPSGTGILGLFLCGAAAFAYLVGILTGVKRMIKVDRENRKTSNKSSEPMSDE